MSVTTTHKILLVVDHDRIAGLYTKRLESENFDVNAVTDGSQALQEALSYKPDLILLDAMMPKVSGYDLLDILRHTPETAHTKIIILSPIISPADRQRAHDLGATGLAVKSEAVITDVIHRINHHLGK